MDKENQNGQQQNFQKKQQVTKTLVFKQYPSIQLSTRDKVIKAIRDHGFDKQNIQWVASEKIHGSNFSIHCSGQKIRYGRRTDFLTEQIQIKCEEPGKFFKQSFYNAQNLVAKYHNKIENVYKDLKQLYPDMIRFAIYGEYFGGNYPGEPSKDFKAVQKGVYYIPHHQFMAFDIRVFTDKTTFWVDVTDIPKILKDNIKSVPIYARGTFDQMLNLQAKIDSTIPQLLGHAKIDKNIIEGFVIRPNRNLKYSNQQRVILKKKNIQFLQATSAPNANKQKQKKEKQQKPLDPQIAPYVEALEVYLNFNRIESVVSKFPDVKDRNKLKIQTIKDIMSDAAKDEFKQPEQAINKKVKAQLDKRVLKMINQYFVKH